MAPRLVPLRVEGTDGVKEFFDREAPAYHEQHGSAGGLLAYRLGLIRRWARFGPSDHVLEIGCGPGNHLLPFADQFERGLGVDVSDAMIAAAEQARLRTHPNARVRFEAGNAETLSTVEDGVMDVVFCVGSFEHMIDKESVLRNVRRVLRAKGRFVCLTPNGDYLWYRRVAPVLGYATARLSTDRFPTRGEIRAMIDRCGFDGLEFESWSFIPRGDMPWVWGVVLTALDGVGRIARVPWLRGGLAFRCWKP